MKAVSQEVGNAESIRIYISYPLRKNTNERSLLVRYFDFKNCNQVSDVT